MHRLAKKRTIEDLKNHCLLLRVWISAGRAQNLTATTRESGSKCGGVCFLSRLWAPRFKLSIISTPAPSCISPLTTPFPRGPWWTHLLPQRSSHLITRGFLTHDRNITWTETSVALMVTRSQASAEPLRCVRNSGETSVRLSRQHGARSPKRVSNTLLKVQHKEPRQF